MWNVPPTLITVAIVLFFACWLGAGHIRCEIGPSTVSLSTSKTGSGSSLASNGDMASLSLVDKYDLSWTVSCLQTN